MKWDGQTVAVICSIILAFCALGVMMQSGFSEINSDIRDLHTRIDDVETGLRQEIANFETGLRQEMGNVETGLRQEIANVDNRLRELAASVDHRLDNIENRLTRIEVHLFGIEPESAEAP